MAKKKTKFTCQECGYQSPKYMGKCPGCGQWNTLVEEMEPVVSSRRLNYANAIQTEVTKPRRLTEVETKSEARIETKFQEFNRVLGGGIVDGSLVLIGGDPGIGKSTLLLQISSQLADSSYDVLYISGEESAKQIKLRADRLHVNGSNLFVVSETDLQRIATHIEEVNPAFVVIDSIQTIHLPDTYRILRAVKNRFGSTNEMGIFEMKELGLAEVLNPSEIFLEERPVGVAGSTVVASMEGTRPVLVEIQALISPTSFGNPRRMATGIDHNRVSLIMAVLEKRTGLLLQNQDAYLKVAGGLKLDEPAIDLAVALSIASSFRDKSTAPTDAVIGEVGLTGEIRRVSRIEQRVQEAAKLGFQRAIIPRKNLGGWTIPDGIEVVGVSNLGEALRLTLGG